MAAVCVGRWCFGFGAVDGVRLEAELAGDGRSDAGVCKDEPIRIPDGYEAAARMCVHGAYATRTRDASDMGG